MSSQNEQQNTEQAAAEAAAQAEAAAKATQELSKEDRARINEGLSDQGTVKQLSSSGEAAQQRRKKRDWPSPRQLRLWEAGTISPIVIRQLCLGLRTSAQRGLVFGDNRKGIPELA